MTVINMIGKSMSKVEPIAKDETSRRKSQHQRNNTSTKLGGNKEVSHWDSEIPQLYEGSVLYGVWVFWISNSCNVPTDGCKACGLSGGYGSSVEEIVIPATV